MPALSTVDQHCEQLGQTALRLLLDVCQESAGLVHRHVVLPPQLVVRASSTRRAVVP